MRIPDEQITPNFRLYEFLHSEDGEAAGVDNTPDAAELDQIRDTARKLQAERDFLSTIIGENLQVFITSGFRSEAVNNLPTIKGSPTSDHRKGRAVDCWFRGRRSKRVIPPKTVIELLDFHGRAFDQMIYYPGQIRIHIGFGPKWRRMILTKAASGYAPGLVG